MIFEINLKYDCFITALFFSRKELDAGPLTESPIYKKYNKKFANLKKNGDWKINAPGLVEDFEVYDNVLFMEKVEGMNFDKLPKTAKKGAGHTAVHSSLHGMFSENGFFDKRQKISASLKKNNFI